MPDEKMYEESFEEEDFAALLNEHLPSAAPKHSGELLDANVVGIMDEAVLVSYGSKEEIPIAKEEFQDPRGELTVHIGDSVRVLVTGWDEDGNPELSFRQARSAEAFDMLEEAEERGVPVRGTVNRVVTGGVMVDVGIPAFMPASQVDVLRVRDLSTLVGQEIEAYVLEFDRSRKRALLSRRKLLAERQDQDRQAFMENVVAGSVLTGTVRDVLDFGVFVQMGSIEGLIPRSELTYDRGVHPSDVVRPGEQIKVKVLEVDRNSGKLTLSRKRLDEDPWLSITDRYPVGTNVSGKVVSVQEFGAFVQLQEGITGLIHAKDISWESKRKSAKEQLREGDTVSCQVTEIDQEKRRLALSLKHLTRDPWQDIEVKYPAGSRHKATVTSLRDFGAIVKLDDYTEGLLHISDLSWQKRYNHPGEVLSEGQEIEVVVLRLDPDKRRISLGMKQLTGSPFDQFVAKNPVGSLVTGKVTRFMSFGAFVELAPGLEGLIHVSELADERVDSPEKVLRMGEDVTVKILETNPEKQRIALSKKQAAYELELENIRQYQRDEKKKESSSAFGSALKEALLKSGEKKK